MQLFDATDGPPERVGIVIGAVITPSSTLA
jgi:hypothetical protein